MFNTITVLAADSNLYDEKYKINMDLVDNVTKFVATNVLVLGQYAFGLLLIITAFSFFFAKGATKQLLSKAIGWLVLLGIIIVLVKTPAAATVATMIEQASRSVFTPAK